MGAWERPGKTGRRGKRAAGGGGPYTAAYRETDRRGRLPGRPGPPGPRQNCPKIGLPFVGTPAIMELKIPGKTGGKGVDKRAVSC